MRAIVATASLELGIDVGTVDLVVQIARRPDGGRRVVAVAEVEGRGEPGDPLVARPLTDAEGRLVALPSRAIRSAAAAPPAPTWIEVAS